MKTFLSLYTYIFRKTKEWREETTPSILVLPEDSISEILSLTSPRDACRSSAISRGFKSAADSDALWESFLPSDYSEILARSDSPVIFSTKKQLYFLLSDNPLLFDGGKLSFTLDKWSGKKCYMVPSKELSIAWKDDERYWNWPSLPESRFTEVAELRFVCWLDIQGKIETGMLSPATRYVAYMVYKLCEDRGHIGPVWTSVRFGRDEVKPEASFVYLEEPNKTSFSDRFWERRYPRSSVLRHPQKRKDGWMEIELGEFYIEHGDEGEVEMQLMETKELQSKSGLIVEGIEVRPKEEA